MVELDATGGDGLPLCDGHHRGARRGLAGQAGEDRPAHVGVVAAEDLVVDADEIRHAVRVPHRHQLHPRGRRHVEVERADLGDEQRLALLGSETRGSESGRQVSGCVVGVVLPLPGAPLLGEPRHLGGDHGVGDGVVEVGPGHPTPAARQRPHHVGVALHDTRPLGIRAAADLLVVGGEHGVRVHGLSRPEAGHGSNSFAGGAVRGRGQPLGPGLRDEPDHASGPNPGVTRGETY